MKTNTEKTNKILWTLCDIERAHTATPTVSAVFAAFVLYLAHESPGETELAGILGANRVSDSLRRVIEDRLGDHWGEYRSRLTAYMKDDLADTIGMAVDGELLFGGKGDACPSSQPVMELAVRLLDLHPGDSVCDFGCAAGDFIHRAYYAAFAEKGENPILGYDICAEAAAVAEIRMVCDDAKAEIRNESFFSMDSFPLQCDKVFCDPPLGVRGLPQNPEVRNFIQTAFRDFPELVPSMPGDWLFAARAVAAMRLGGRAVVVMTPSAMSDGRGDAFRRYFVQRKLVEAVVELPSKLFSHTNIPLCMVVFSHGNESVKMIRADELANASRRKNVIGKNHADTIAACLKSAAAGAPPGLDRYRVEVARETLLRGDCCLAPKRHFAPPTTVRDGIALGDLSEAMRGATIPAHELDALVCGVETSFLYISSGDINDGVLPSNPTYLREIPPNHRAACAQAGDIVISRVQASGAGFKAAVVETLPGKTVLPNGNLWVVRVDRQKTDPYFVKACLDSEYGQRFLADASTGAMVLTLGTRALEQFPVPALPLERQREIGEICRARAIHYSELRRALAASRADLGRVFEECAADCLVKTDGKA